MSTKVRTKGLAVARTRRGAPAFLAHAAEVATFWGFRPLRELERASGLPRVRGAHSFSSAAAIGAHIAAQRGSPALSYFATPLPSHPPRGVPPRECAEFGLQVVGTGESVGEVLLLKVVAGILSEWGLPVVRIRVNAMGDRDSKARFVRELGSYLRRQSANLDDNCREALAESPLSTYACERSECRAVLESGPRAMNFLTEKSRLHFREVLEHVERLGIPWELDDLLASDSREPRLLFAADIGGEDGVVLSSSGGRFDDSVKQPAVHASIFIRKRGLSAGSFTAAPPALKPKVYFVQLGLRAKLQGFAIMDLLRAAGVPTLQSLEYGRLGPQMEQARAAGVSRLLLMGQREALDGTVVLRAMDNSSQTVIPITELARHLRHLR